ncbi:MAG TPA: hypothetical protein VM639_13020 [Dongiaceae bacterium]|nr:hypothetical protein [Dongiaceae bacterium]
MTQISAASPWTTGASLAETLTTASRRRAAVLNPIAGTDAVTALPARDRLAHACIPPDHVYPAGIDIATG